MRIGCALMIAAAFLIWAGGQKTYTALNNSTPTEMTCADFVAAKPDAEWLKLKSGVLMLLHAAHRERTGNSIGELYIPLVSKEDMEGSGDKTPRIHILLKTEDAELKAIYEEMAVVDKKNNQAEMMMFVVKNMAKLYNERDVEGVVQFGFGESSKDRDQLAKITENLAPDFIIIDHNAKPSMGTGLAMLLGGLVLLFFMGKSFLSKDESAAKDTAAPTPPVGDQPPADAAPSAPPKSDA